jgi:hypothetical protein
LVLMVVRNNWQQLNIHLELGSLLGQMLVKLMVQQRLKLMELKMVHHSC